MQKSEYLVTGASGFVGSFVTDLLVSLGKRVRVLIRDSAREFEFTARGIDVVVGDLTDPIAVGAAVKNVEKVVHIAALFRQAGLPSSEFFRVNVEGTRLLMEHSIEAGVKRFIHCSTVGVHGHIDNPPANESTAYNPGDPYQQSKTEGEKLVRAFLKQGKIGGAVIRPAMIYGPGDTRTLKLFKMIAKGRFFYVGGGDSLVHFVDVRDLARGFVELAERDDLNGETFILAGERALPLNELAGIVADIMGVRPPWIRVPVKPMQILGTVCEALCTPVGINPPIYRRRVDFYTKDRSFDISKARSLLDYQPRKHLVHELIEIIDSYIRNGSIELPHKRIPSVILRDMEGQIRSWSLNAQSVYGWTDNEAVGKISHSLLATKFPSDLSAIRDVLEKAGEWEGRLEHRSRAGRHLKVKSRWRVVDCPSGREPLILEINHVQSESPGASDQLFSMMGALSSAVSAI